MTEDEDAIIITAEKAVGRRVSFRHFGKRASIAIAQLDDGPHCGVFFERDGKETVQFALSPQALGALRKLLTTPEAGRAWRWKPKPAPLRWKIACTFNVDPTPTPSSEPV